MMIKLFDMIKVKMPRLPKQSRRGDFVVAVAFNADDWHEHWTALAKYKFDDFFGGDYWHLDNDGKITGGCLGNVSLREANLYWFDTFEEAKRFRNFIELQDEVNKIYEQYEQADVPEDEYYYWTSSSVFDAFRWTVTRP